MSEEQKIKDLIQKMDSIEHSVNAVMGLRNEPSQVLSLSASIRDDLHRVKEGLETLRRIVHARREKP